MAAVTRDDLERSLDRLRTRVDDPRAGILGPTSIAWRLGGDLAVFLGGGRAALLQLAHPMVAYAVDQHSQTRTDVVGRFQRTFRNVFAMVFGDLHAAFGAARRVHAIHAQISGTIPASIGRWRAGTPYQANDVDALRWVHATLVDTTLVVRERLDGALAREVKDRYVIEMNRFAALFGIPDAVLPASWAQHAAYMREMLGSDQLAVAPCAKQMASFLIGRGDPQVQPRLGRIAEAIAASLLPEELARAFALRSSPLRVGAALRSFAAIYRRLPDRAIALPAHIAARRRLAGRGPSHYAAWTERQLFGLARQATGQA